MSPTPAQSRKDALTAEWLSIGERKLSIRQRYRGPENEQMMFFLLRPLNNRLDEILHEMYPRYMG